jgi:ferredoxin-NADP reductase
MATTTIAVVKSVIQINNKIKEYILSPDRYVRFEPGQFLQLAIGEINVYDIWPDSRAFSIASPYDNNKKELRVIVKRSSSFTKHMLSSLAEDDTVTVRYPLGDFYLENDADNVVFIAAGTGLTPFLSYINSQNEAEFKGKLYLFHSVRSKDDLIHYEELLNHSKDNDKFLFKTFLTRETEQEAVFFNQRISGSFIVSLIDNPKGSKYYICGPTHFIEDITEQLRREDINNIYSEIWD